MLRIAEARELLYYGALEVAPLEAFLNEPKFTAKNSSLSYRQINNLFNDGMLPDNRYNARAWRKFSYRELMYLEIVSELKAYGLEYDQYEDLKDAFFGKGKGQSEMAIGLVLLQEQIILTLNQENQATFYDTANFQMFGGNLVSFLLINLNELSNKLLLKVGYNKTISYHGLMEEFLQPDRSLNAKEIELLGIIRSKDYKNIEIKTKEGKIELVTTDKVVKGHLTPKQITDLIISQNYADIKVTKRDGVVAHYTLKQTHKL